MNISVPPNPTVLANQNYVKNFTNMRGQPYCTIFKMQKYTLQMLIKYK